MFKIMDWNVGIYYYIQCVQNLRIANVNVNDNDYIVTLSLKLFLSYYLFCLILN